MDESGTEQVIQMECLQALRRCEELAAAWGLPVAIRSFEELHIPGDRGAAGFFIERPLPQWDVHNALVTVDAQAATTLSDPVCRLSSWISHELAHASVSALEHCTIPCGLQSVSAVQAGIREPAVPVELLKRGMPSWAGHEHFFIRSLIHVSWRLRAAGIHVCDVWSFPAGDYKLSPLAWYSDTLGPECEEMANLPIIEVMKRKSPAAFLLLWNEDLARAAGRAAPAEKFLGSSRRSLSPCHSSEEASSAKS